MLRLLARRSSAVGLLAAVTVAGAGALSLSSSESSRTTFLISPSSWHFQSLFSNPVAGPYMPNFFMAGGPSHSKPIQEAPGKSVDDPDCCRGCMRRDSVAKAAAVAGPAVVNISAYHGANARSVGSGTIIDPNGTIVTCAHCVADFGRRNVLNAKVGVTLQDGREFGGIVLNADFVSDIAVVKIESKTPLPAAKLGTSSKVRPGEWVIALGSPHFLQNTVTAGIVSYVDRRSTDLGLGGSEREYLQTDCAINNGNSGGPLVNLDGEVVGINQIKVQAADGLSFAIPIDSVSKIIEQFKKNGRVVRPWLGLKMFDLDEINISHLKERNPSFPDVSKGVLVPMVTPGSPAERAGFLPGDIVIKFDGHSVESVKQIIDIMDDKVGKPFKVLVNRANKTKILIVIPVEADA